MTRQRNLGPSGDQWVTDQKAKIIAFERSQHEKRVKRLLQDRPQPGDFALVAHAWIYQTCGLETPAPRDRGSETIMRFEGGRDVGKSLKDELTSADIAAMSKAHAQALRAVAERNEKFLKIEEKARGGVPPVEETP